MERTPGSYRCFMKINTVSRVYCCVGTAAESIRAIWDAAAWAPNGEEGEGGGVNSSRQVTPQSRGRWKSIEVIGDHTEKNDVQLTGTVLHLFLCFGHISFTVRHCNRKKKELFGDNFHSPLVFANKLINNQTAMYTQPYSSAPDVVHAELIKICALVLSLL